MPRKKKRLSRAPSPESRNKPTRGKGAEGPRTRALHVLAHMRREDLSLAEAARLEHVKPATVLRYVGSALRRDKTGGRYRATATDKFHRKLNLPTPSGPVPV